MCTRGDQCGTGNRQVGRICAVQNLVHVCGGTVIALVVTRTNRHQPGGHHVLRVAVDKVHLVLCRPAASAKRRELMKVSTAFTSPLAPNANALSNPASTSSGFRMSSDSTAMPSFWASERSNSNWAALLALLLLRAIATLSTVGTMRLSICSRSPTSWGAYAVVPVTFVLGRSKLLTTPMPTGSKTASITIGIVFVALAAARVAATFAAAIMSILRSTNSVMTLLYSASSTASRYSMRIFFPST